MAIRFLSNQTIDSTLDLTGRVKVSGSSTDQYFYEGSRTGVGVTLRLYDNSNNIYFDGYSGIVLRANQIGGSGGSIVLSGGNVGVGIVPAASVALDVKEPDTSNDLILGLTAGTGARAQIRSVVQSADTESVLSFHTTLSSSTQERLRILATGALSLGNSGTNYGTAGQVLTSSGNSVPNWSTPTTGTITGSGTANKVTKFTGATAIGDGPITFATNDSTFAGKILVGTGATAAASLNAFTTTVSANLFSALRVIENTGASSYWDIGATNGASTILNFYHNAATTPKITFTHLGGATFAGNVGIGYTSPASILHVGSTGTNAYSTTITKGSNMKGIINTLSNNADDMVGIYFATGTTTEGTHWSGITGSRSDNASHWGTQLNFYTHANDVAAINDATQKMVIKGDGNVGIGTTSPLGILQLNVDSDHSIMRITAGDSSIAGIDFGKTSDIDDARIRYYNSTRYMEFFVANGERMRITSAGNVGIGTNSPASTLEVDGNIQSDTTSIANSAAYIRGADVGIGIGQSASSPYGSWIQSRRNTDGVAFPLSLNPSGSNVGIGATDPVKKLDVRGQLAISNNASSYWYMDRNDSTGNFEILTDTNSSVFNIDTSGKVIINDNTIGDKLLLAGDNAGTARGLMFNCSTTTNQGDTWDIDAQSSTGIIKFSTTSTERMRITSDGMVGIGMTPSTAGSSTYMLQMYNSGSQCLLAIGNGTSGNGPLNGLVIGNDAGNAYVLNRESTPLIFSTNNTERLRILSGGNVGINVTAPSERLEVNTGNIFINGENRGLIVDSISKRVGFMKYSGHEAYIARVSGQDFGIVRTGGSNIEDGSSLTTDLYISANGEVGIGTTNPASKLTVVSNGTIAKFDSTASYSDIVFNNTSGTGGFLNFGGTTSFNVYVGGGAGGNLEMSLTNTGTLTVSGDVVAFGSPSDKRLKENIKPIKTALDKVTKLQGVSFDWKDKHDVLDREGNPVKLKKWKNDLGFIAQDVQKVVPELVRENENGMLSVRHQSITPILLEAIKELEARVKELENNCDCKK